MRGGREPQRLHQRGEPGQVGQFTRVAGGAAPLAVGGIHRTRNVLGAVAGGVADVDHARRRGLRCLGLQFGGRQQWLGCPRRRGHMGGRGEYREGEQFFHGDLENSRSGKGVIVPRP